MKAVEALVFPLYQPIEVPAFAHCSAQQPCWERLDLMMPYIAGAGTILDVGCHTGWFCRQLSLAYGFQTIGIDRSPEWIAAAKELHPSGNYCLGDVAETELPQVDIVLCLSVAMYFGDASEAIFWKLSHAARTMFLDFGGMYATSMPFDESTAIQWMLKHSVFSRGSLIGRSSIHRPMFMFSR